MQIALLTLSGLLLFLNVPTFVLQIQQGNSGSICMGLWVLLGNFEKFVNLIVWRSDAVDRAPLWCDISVKLRMGRDVGTVAAVMCIARFLAAVVSPRATAITQKDRRNRAIFDYSVSLGLPVICMACHILYQPNRYQISSGLGCQPTTSLVWPMLILWTIWTPVLAAIGTLYAKAVYTFYRLSRHRRNFGRIVAGSHSALTTGRFARLAALSFSYLAVGLPLAVYATIIGINTSNIYYDYSWSYVHSAWHIYPVLTYTTPSKASLKLWTDVIAGAIYFMAFGFSAETLDLYRRVLRWTPRSSTRSRSEFSAQTVVLQEWAISLALTAPRLIGHSLDSCHMSGTQKDINSADLGVHVWVKREEEVV